MTKIRLENEEMIDRLGCKMFENDDAVAGDYDDNYELDESGINIRDLKDMNKLFGDGCLLIDDNDLDYVENRGGCYICQIWLDLTKVVASKLDKPVMIPTSDAIIEPDMTLLIYQ